MQSPFWHFYSTFDTHAIIRRHAAPGLKPTPGYLTNYAGVLIDPKFFPAILDGRAGTIEAPPFPANWHADLAEFASVYRAVELAQWSFTMIELGCGWGCWMNNSGLAARRLGLNVHLIGIEGDPGHVRFAEEALTTNGFQREQFTLHHGIAAGRNGVALFPKQGLAGESWGLTPILHPSDAQRDEALSSGGYETLPMIALDDVALSHSRIDLLHIDIQGGEADLVAEALPFLKEKVAFMVIGTHSRQIEGRLFDLLINDGWTLEVERPAIYIPSDGRPLLSVDGVQGWRNTALLPHIEP